jgi:DNA invertase Pin-like site-specific DNA recombinase
MQQVQQRAAILRRVSTEEQRQGWSLISQQVDALEHCRKSNYTVVTDEEEVDSGDLLDEREGLWRIRELAKRGLIDVVVIWRLDRLSRNVQNQQVLLYEFGVVAPRQRPDGSSVRVESLTETIDDTEAGRAYMITAGIVGEYGRKTFRARSMRNRLARVQSGRPLAGRSAPYGLRWTDDSHISLVADPSNAQVVRDIFAWAEAGEPTRAIAKRLTDAGIATPFNRLVWNPRTIENILRNPVYWGEYTAYRWTTKVTEGIHPLTGRSWRKQHVVHQIDTSKHYILSGVAEALVKKEQAMRADEGLRARRLHSTSSREEIASDFLLAQGFARYGHCGNTMAAFNRVQRKRGRNGILREYHYRNYQRSGDVCHHKQIAMPVETWVWEQVSAKLVNPAPLWDQIEQHWRQYDTPTATRVQAFTARLREIAEESANLTQSLARMHGQRGAHYIEAELARLGEEEAETQRRLKLAETQHADWNAARDLLQNLLDGVSIEAASIAEKRLVLRALGVTVTMYRPGHNGRSKGPNARPTTRRWVLEAAPLSATDPYSNPYVVVDSATTTPLPQVNQPRPSDPNLPQ